MVKKLVQYQVTIEVDDNGEFDQWAMRDGVRAGIQMSQNEGGLTTLDDETTIIHGFNVTHLGTK